MNKTLLALCLAAVALSAAAMPSLRLAAKGNIVDIAKSDPDLSTLVELLVDAKLVETLEGKGPFTVFAPTNEAFNKLPASVLNKLKSNVTALTDVLTYHVASGDVQSKDLHNGEDIKTLEGKRVVASVTAGTVLINNSTVTTADIEATNGVVHIIDTVLIPPVDIVSLAEATPELSTLVTAVVKANLASVLSGPGPFTVFAPTNDAFNALGQDTINKLLSNPKELAKLLEYHVVSGDLPASVVVERETLSNLDGKSLEVHVRSFAGVTQVFVDAGQVVAANNFASNGIVHVIDRVLLP